MSEELPRICYAIASQRTGGTERRVARLSNAMAARGLPTRLIIGSEPADGPPPCDPAVDVCYLNHRGPLRNATMKLARAIAEFRPDVFHGFLNAAYFGVPAARWLRVPVVVMSLTNAADRFRDLRLERLLIRFSLKLAHGATINSHGARESYLRDWRVAARKLVTVPGSLALDRVPDPDPTVRAEVREELGLAAADVAMISVARLVDYKGCQELLDAIAQLAPRHPEGVLLAVGDGPMYDALAEQVAERGLERNFRLLGRRSDVFRLLQGADLFVLASHMEGMPNALLEAMASGLPAVATEVPGSSELVVPGATGWLAPPKDAGGLATVIESALARREVFSDYGAAARRRVVERYSDEVVMEQYLALYQQLRRGGAAMDTPGLDQL